MKAAAVGGSLLLAAVGVDRTPHRDITPAWYLFGGAAFFDGVFDLVDRTPFEIVFTLAFTPSAENKRWDT